MSTGVGWLQYGTETSRLEGLGTQNNNNNNINNNNNNNNNMQLQEIKWEGVDWKHLVKYRDKANCC